MRLQTVFSELRLASIAALSPELQTVSRCGAANACASRFRKISLSRSLRSIAHIDGLPASHMCIGGHTLWLYQAPDSEWNPHDGMRGFITRLDEFLRKSAVGELDPEGAPLHPPTTHRSSRDDIPMVIPRADAPALTDGPWLGFAQLNRVSASRHDLVAWFSLEADQFPINPAPTVLLDSPLTHEYPTTIGDLIRALEAHGVTRRLVLALIRCALISTPSGYPILMIVGAPMRGIKGSANLRQHLTAWFIDPVLGDAVRPLIRDPG